MSAEGLRKFEEWRAKSTEFSKEEFFEAVRAEMARYNVMEVPCCGDSIAFEGKTSEMETYEYPEGSLTAKTVRFRCNYRLVAKYDPSMCSIDATISGARETHMGQCSPMKTREDLEGIGHCVMARYLAKRAEAHVQMSLFEFI